VKKISTTTVMPSVFIVQVKCEEQKMFQASAGI